jgi:phosphoglycolate phosphatase
VATNKPLQISDAILARLNLDRFFVSILASDSVQPPFSGKGAMVRQLIQTNQLEPAVTWYVGDADEDAAAAAENGLPFVWAAYGYGQIESSAAKSIFRTIHSLAKLKTLLG